MASGWVGVGVWPAGNVWWGQAVLHVWWGKVVLGVDFFHAASPLASPGGARCRVYIFLAVFLLFNFS